MNNYIDLDKIYNVIDNHLRSIIKNIPYRFIYVTNYKKFINKECDIINSNVRIILNSNISDNLTTREYIQHWNDKYDNSFKTMVLSVNMYVNGNNDKSIIDDNIIDTFKSDMIDWYFKHFGMNYIVSKFMANIRAYLQLK